jgi:hypothetical protein
VAFAVAFAVAVDVAVAFALAVIPNPASAGEGSAVPCLTSTSAFARVAVDFSPAACASAVASAFAVICAVCTPMMCIGAESASAGKGSAVPCLILNYAFSAIP